MANRSTPQEANLHLVSSPFAEMAATGSVPAYNPTCIQVPGHADPEIKYYHYKANGDIGLGKSPNLKDDWWGLGFKGFRDWSVIVGQSEAMLKTFDCVKKMACSQESVLIEGETGTGKELVAKALASGQSGQYIPIDFAGQPDTLLDSELRGHVKGAFTGATSDRKGAFEIAHKGTLLLDNIDDIPPNMQVKLLRILEDRAVKPIGSNKSTPVDVRVLAATKQNLSSLVEQRKFMADLYFRIHTVRIYLPPLRSRQEDIPLLTVFFVLKKRSVSKRKITTIAHETLKRLCAFNWPGNVRQLERAIGGALAMGEGPVLRPEDFTLTSISDTGVHLSSPWRTNSGNPGRACYAQTEKKSNRVIELVHKNPGIRTRDLASIVGCSTRTIQRKLAVLRQAGLIVSEKDKDKRFYLHYPSVNQLTFT